MQKKVKKTDRARHCRLSPPELNEVFIHFASPILQSENIEKTKNHIQHANISCYSHSVAVAYYSLKLANRLRVGYNQKSLVRGALLHDYFLYDWHEKHEPQGLHGFTHPRTALANALLDFDLDDIEKNIIYRHMFPLTLVPPRYRESLIVCAVDKICSFAEVFRLNHYPSFEYADGVVVLC